MKVGGNEVLISRETINQQVHSRVVRTLFGMDEFLRAAAEAQWNHKGVIEFQKDGQNLVIHDLSSEKISWTNIKYTKDGRPAGTTQISVNLFGEGEGGEESGLSYFDHNVKLPPFSRETVIKIDEFLDRFNTRTRRLKPEERLPISVKLHDLILDTLSAMPECPQGELDNILKNGGAIWFLKGNMHLDIEYKPNSKHISYVKRLIGPNGGVLTEDTVIVSVLGRDVADPGGFSHNEFRSGKPDCVVDTLETAERIRSSWEEVLQSLPNY